MSLLSLNTTMQTWIEVTNLVRCYLKTQQAVPLDLQSDDIDRKGDRSSMQIGAVNKAPRQATAKAKARTGRKAQGQEQ